MSFNKETIHELYPGAEDMMYEPMLIHPSTELQLKQACASGEYFGQLKKDGAFYQFVKTARNKCYLFGRTVSKVTGLLTEKIANAPQLKSAFSSLPPRTIIIGEIYYPDKSSKSVTQIMGCLPHRAIERQLGDYGVIHYYIYDILMFDGIDFVLAQTPNEIRYKILKAIYEKYNIKQYDYIELAESWDDNLYKRIGDALNTGEEGMVLKRKTGIYLPGKRPDSNLKAKKVDFMDAIIIGFEEPTKQYTGKEIKDWQYWAYVDFENNKWHFLPIGKHYEEDKHNLAVTKPFYMGWKNAHIKIGAYDEFGQLIEIGIIHSGLSDDMKEDMTAHPEKYLNHVCAIQCMEKDAKIKTIRHGFFIQMQYDKNPEECLIKDIFVRKHT